VADKAIDLARDCLDNRLVGSDGAPLGRVDGIVLELVPGEAPRVVAIEAGATTRAQRFHPRVARWVARILRAVSAFPTGPYRIEWNRMRLDGRDCHVPMDAQTSPLRATERWARTRVIGRIPGA